ncbi:MAG: TlpA family protein disulfide reductase [Candidatus Promineofilum sp.]|nr:TlpA family protein disulfide reductase [Promineifilum sp.]
MKRERLEWLALIVLVALLGGGWIVLSRETEADNQPIALTTAPYVGALAPDFTAQTHDGANFTLSDFNANGGTPVVLNFWATWCPPCRVEMPHFEAAAQLYGDDVAVLGVNQAESGATIAAYARNHGLSYPLLVDEEMTINHLYGILNLPTTVFIDANGIVREVLVGTMSRAVLEERIEKLVGQ